MTDLEMTKLCARAMDTPESFADTESCLRGRFLYEPLVNDDQAMALVKRFKLASHWNPVGGKWLVEPPNGNTDGGWSPDLNRAIVECVAKMEVAKRPGTRDENVEGKST